MGIANKARDAVIDARLPMRADAEMELPCSQRAAREAASTLVGHPKGEIGGSDIGCSRGGNGDGGRTAHVSQPGRRLDLTSAVDTAAAGSTAALAPQTERAPKGEPIDHKERRVFHHLDGGSAR